MPFIPSTSIELLVAEDWDVSKTISEKVSCKIDLKTNQTDPSFLKLASQDA